MEIAAIVVTYNDGYKINEWISHHQTYKGELYKHIIVDNGSSNDYIKKVKKYFPESVIIRRSFNGGSTAAYNDGIRLALSDPKVDAIMLIGNDVMLEKGGVTNLAKFLFSNEEYGMVAPVLLAKDSQLIDDFGCEIDKVLYMKPYDVGKNITDIEISSRIVTSVTGGMNMAKREFYEKIGLQDEKLFMYSDEVDMAIRAKKAGFKMAVTKDVKSWHQHINPNNRDLRLGYSVFLVNRNKIYLGYKHFGIAKAFRIFSIQILKFPIELISFFRKKHYNLIIYYLLGSLFGVFRIKSNFKPIIENKI